MHATYVYKKVVRNTWGELETQWFWKCVCVCRDQEFCIGKCDFCTGTYSFESAYYSAYRHEYYFRTGEVLDYTIPYPLPYKTVM